MRIGVCEAHTKLYPNRMNKKIINRAEMEVSGFLRLFENGQIWLQDEISFS